MRAQDAERALVAVVRQDAAAEPQGEVPPSSAQAVEPRPLAPAVVLPPSEPDEVLRPAEQAAELQPWVLDEVLRL